MFRPTAPRVSGYVVVKGYALDGNLVSNVDVFVDGTDDANRVTVAGGANINLPRPDVMQQFPQYAGTPGSTPGGWRRSRRPASRTARTSIYVGITDGSGCQYFLAPKAIKVDNTANQAPFGNMDFPLPNSGVDANGVLTVSGWALDDRKIDHVDIIVDGLLERQAVTGIYRCRHRRGLPGQPPRSSRASSLNIDSTRYSTASTISARAVDDQGQQATLGTSRVQIFNNAPNLGPIGEVGSRSLNANWFGSCFPVSPGWPLRRPDGHRRPAPPHVRERLGARGLSRTRAASPRSASRWTA